MVIWQWSTYPISSTVVPKGLCQQDRKMKLLKVLLLPPAFGMATDFTKAFWESVQGYPGRVGNRNSSNRIQSPWDVPEVSLLPLGEGGFCLYGLRVWILRVPGGRRIALAGTAQVGRGYKTLEKDMKQHNFKIVVFGLSILNVRREQVDLCWKSAVWRSWVLFWNEMTSLGEWALHSAEVWMSRTCL